MRILDPPQGGDNLINGPDYAFSVGDKRHPDLVSRDGHASTYTMRYRRLGRYAAWAAWMRYVAKTSRSRRSAGIGWAGYEAHCASCLRDAGWRVRQVGQTGDQGADVIATMAECSLALQCKHYSKPVGNRAVQEVIGARIHYRCTHTAVVTEAGFTPSARTLARSADVRLMSSIEISALSHRLGIARYSDLLDWIASVIRGSSVR